VAVDDKRIFDVEVLDVGVLLGDHLPLISVVSILRVALVSTNHELEAVVLEVDLHEDQQHLFSELHVDVLRNSEVFGQLTCFEPSLLSEIVVVAPLVLVAADKEDVRQLALVLLVADAGTAELFWRLWNLLYLGDLAVLDI